MRRLLTVLAAIALLAGGAGAVPAQAAPDSDFRGAVSSTDPAGDASGSGERARAAADLRKVQIHLPSTPGGTMKFRFKFAKLHNGQKAGAPRQRAAAVLVKRRDFSRLWSVEVNNFNGKVKVHGYDEDSITAITPEVATLRRTFKRGGVLAVTVSTEWLEAKRVTMDGYGVSGGAVDEVGTFGFDVSGPGETTVAEPTPPAPAREAKRYANCDALLRDWPNGVAQGPKAARKQVRDGNSRPASGKRARGVYQTNKGSLDRDKDGTACEN